VKFLEELERFVILGDYLFVHAGIDPSKSVEDQTDRDLFWSRDRFLNDSRRRDHVIVHGHTPTRAPYRDYRRIGIDTGACVSGRLTAAMFCDHEVVFLTASLEGGVRRTVSQVA
jgi:serine/threonine protein phosphatase 1